MSAKEKKTAIPMTKTNKKIDIKMDKDDSGNDGEDSLFDGVDKLPMLWLCTPFITVYIIV